MCAAQPTDRSGETWVGTALGVKRLAKDGTLLRLYTRSDGLAGDVILALAVEKQEAWAIVHMTGAGHCGLCRLDRKLDKWTTLREITVSLPNYTDWASLPDFIATGSGRYVCFVIGNKALVDPGQALYLFDRHEHVWKDVPHRFAANWLCAQTDADGRNSIFVATNGGLLRYQVEKNEWQTYLPDRAVVGGTQRRNSSLWLATLTTSDKHTIPPRAQLQLTRFDTGSDIIVSDAISPHQKSERSSDEFEFPGPRRSVVENDGSIWLTVQHENGFFATLPAIPSLPETVQRYDEQTHIWSQPNLDSSADIPAAVTAAAWLAGYRIPDELMSRSLPGWISPTANLPVQPSASSPWMAEKGILLHRNAGRAAVDRVSLPPKIVLMTPNVSAVKTVAGILYALSGDVLWSRNLAGGVWAEHRLPNDRTLSMTSRRAHLFSSVGKIWVEEEGRLRAFDPRTGKWADAITVDGGKQLVGVENGDAWFTSPFSGDLKRIPLSGEQTENVSVEMPPRPEGLSPKQYLDPLSYQIVKNQSGLPPPKYYGGRPLRVSLGKAWYASSPYSYPSVSSSALRGYDLKTHRWTKPLNLAGRVYGVAMYATKRDLYVSFGGRDLVTGAKTIQAPAGALYRFREDTQQWENVAPACAQWHGSAAAPIIISVDAQAIWLADNGHNLWRWNRKLRTWASYPTKTLFYEGGSFDDNEPRTAAAQCDSIYLTSVHGVRRFSLSSQTWAALPFPENASDFHVENFTSDQRAVWAVCEDGAGGSCVARYDLKARKWMFFTPPQSQSSVDHFLRIVSDGDTGTLLEGPILGNLYNLDPHTGRIQDLKPALLESVVPGKDHVYAHLERVAADGAAIWVLATVRSSTVPATVQPSTTLASWSAHRGFTVYTVPEEITHQRTANFWSGNIVVEPKNIFLLLPGGIGRFLKAGNFLQPVMPPPGFPTPQEAYTETMTSAPDGSLWLIGRDTVMHWTDSAAAITNQAQ